MKSYLIIYAGLSMRTIIGIEGAIDTDAETMSMSMLGPVYCNAHDSA